jgi:hypothetical protein
MTIDLTPGQLRAVFAALDSYVNAGSYEECRVVFGSEPGVRAAENALQKVRAALWGRR